MLCLDSRPPDSPSTQAFPSSSLLYQRRQWHPTPALLPGKSHGWRSLVGCSPWGREESDTTERLHFHLSLSCIGEGNGNPLQCSCLENPRDGGAWWLPSMGSHRVGHDWSDLAAAAAVSSIHSIVQINNHATIFKVSFPQTPLASLVSRSSKPHPKSMHCSLLPTISLVQMTITSHLNCVMSSHPNHTSSFLLSSYLLSSWYTNKAKYLENVDWIRGFHFVKPFNGFPSLCRSH